MQQRRHLKNNLNKNSNRASILVLIIVFFFLLLAWFTWCFFEWKIKMVERSPFTDRPQRSARII